jgi:hypothetical protein
MPVAACSDALAVLSSNQERTLFERRHHDDALRLGCDIEGNALIRCRHQFMEHGMGSIQAVCNLGVGLILRDGESRKAAGNDGGGQYLSHFSPSNNGYGIIQPYVRCRFSVERNRRHEN